MGEFGGKVLPPNLKPFIKSINMFTLLLALETDHQTTALNHDLLLHLLLQNDLGNVSATKILYSFHKLNQKSPNLLFYIVNDNPNTVHVKTVITSLKEKSWFMDYVIKWIWYNSDDGENENDFAVEDVLYHYTKRMSVA